MSVKEFLQKYAHWLVLGVALVWTILECLPPSTRSGEINLNEFGKIAVLDGGRVKPLDSLARTSLLLISNQQEFRDSKGKRQPAIRWLIDVMSSRDPVGGPAGEHKVFRIEETQVLALLNLQGRPGSYRYSYKEIMPTRRKLAEAFQVAEAKDPHKRDHYDRKVMEVADRVARYEALVQRATPFAVPPKEDGGEWVSLGRIDNVILETVIEPLFPKAEAHVRERLFEKMKKDGIEFDKLKPEDKELFEQMVHQRAIEVLREVLEQKRGEIYPAAAAFNRILDAYSKNLPDEFHKEVENYRSTYFAHVAEGKLKRTSVEMLLNRVSPFFLSAVLYVCVFVIAAIGWLAWPDTCRRAAFWLGVLTLAIHSFALLGRMYVMDRPMVFVTNLYGSAVFIGWGCVGIGVVLEIIFRNGIGSAVGALLGGASNIIAHNIQADSSNPDTLEMMQAVLDTNFWLSTHVTTVVLGYVATLVAGALGLAFIVTGVFTRGLTRENARSLSSMMYGIVCFATLLSFTGTVLGGIWADQSWGRFWGWDPKENGAVLVVIWNALILHARWGGMVKQRGIAVLTLVGFMITFWSWFGTNQLGVGLHAYGFNSNLASMCTYIWIGTLIMIGIGLIPLRHWASFHRPKTTPHDAIPRTQPFKRKATQSSN